MLLTVGRSLLIATAFRSSIAASNQILKAEPAHVETKENGCNAAQNAWRSLRRRAHLPPRFVIIGTQRGGTTSLYNYLTAHPRVAGTKRREVHFFDLNYQRGFDWYLQQFPPAWRGKAVTLRHREVVTGESSPYYLFHPWVPQRLRAALPSAKLIVLLRNPVDRAFSHYQLMRKKGRETLTFADAIAAEPERLHAHAEAMERDPHHHSPAHFDHSYLARGVYADQLQRWLEAFPREQLHVIKSEDLYRDPQVICTETLRFLDPKLVDDYQANGYERFNSTAADELPKSLRVRLEDYFRPHNERLCGMLKRNLQWTARTLLPLIIDMIDGNCDLLELVFPDLG